MIRSRVCDISGAHDTGRDGAGFLCRRAILRPLAGPEILFAMHSASTSAAVEEAPAASERAGLPPDVSAPLALVERAIASYLHSRALPPNLLAAIEYALLGGGKRLRPLLVLHSCRAAGGDFDRAVPAAAAVEMIHAFSLVHDDLPALDNDDLRRGLPTVHKAHGEAMAILVGDGLMSLAFQLLAHAVPDPALSGALMRELAEGTTDMISGQVLDTLGGFVPAEPPEQRLSRTHRLKTGALIRASCRLGAVSALGSARQSSPLSAVTAYGEAVGLMFQVVDDLLDVEQSTEHTGKRTAKDAGAGKLTYPAVLGAERSRAEIERLVTAAHEAIRPLGAPAGALGAIADYLAVRTR